MSSAAGAVVIPCQDLDEAIAAYGGAGFRLEALGPADDPRWAEMSMSGLQLVLTCDANRDEPYLRVDGAPASAGLPDLVEPATVQPSMSVPAAEPKLVVTHETVDGWNRGRAGMLYRDLIPERHGGAYIASHIQIPDGGPVPDYVHHHDIAFQMIFCHRGWVRVVYQDQGPAFVMEPGDLVLQPPGIRHRVLESSDECFVVEITCPASHRTNLDHELELPNDSLEPNRAFGGQRFVRHVGSEARWQPVPDSPFERQASAIAAATNGVASADILRPRATEPETEPPSTAPSTEPWPLDHSRDLRFLFMIEGTASLTGPDGSVEELQPGSSVAVPPGSGFGLGPVDADGCILDVSCTVAATT